MSNTHPTTRQPASLLKRLFFTLFILSASVVVFFLAFNYSVPFLKDRVDHTILDTLSRIGALSYPFAVALTGVGYVGIILSSGRTKQGHCVHCGYDVRGLPESRCPECGTGFDSKNVPSHATNQGL